MRCGQNEVSSSDLQIRVDKKLWFTIVGYIELGRLHDPVIGGFNIFIKIIVGYIELGGGFMTH